MHQQQRLEPDRPMHLVRLMPMPREGEAMRFSYRRRAVVGAAVALVLGVAAMPVLGQLGPDGSPPDPSGGVADSALNNPDVAVARPVAERLIQAAGRSVEAGSANRVGPSGSASYSLWSYRTSRGGEHMLVNPLAAPVSWIGCSRLPATIQLCGSSVRPGVLLITGAATPDVTKVRAVFAGGATVDGLVASEAWLVQIPAAGQIDVPVRVEALSRSGALLAAASTTSVSALVAAVKE